MIRPTGLVPDRERTRERDARVCPYECSAELGAVGSEPFAQPIAWIRDQPRFPDCVGEACAAGIDSVLLGPPLLGPPWASAVSLWREARRRQGRIEQIQNGTRFEYALEGLAQRGWDPYVAGEEFSVVEAGLGAPDAGDDPADELAAFDHRAPTMLRHRIVGSGADWLDAVDSAVRSTLLVVLGTGLRTPFFSHVGHSDEPDVVLDTLHIGGTENGHGMRVFAVHRINGVRVFGLQNSHGIAFGGLHLPDGTWQPGCCWASERVIANAWDVHAFEAP